MPRTEGHGPKRSHEGCKPGVDVKGEGAAPEFDAPTERVQSGVKPLEIQNLGLRKAVRNMFGEISILTCTSWVCMRRA